MTDTARQRLLARLSATERRLRIGGCSTVVLEAGAGPPLVLLHGGIECGGAVWAPIVPTLAESHRVIVPDLPGLGESEPIESVTDGFASWLAELIQATCADSPTVVAHSLVGSLTAGFAARRGDLLRRLVVYAAPGVGPYRMPLGLRALAIRFAIRPTERNGERFERWAFFDYDGFRARDASWLAAFGAYTRSRAGAAHVKRAMRQLIGRGTKGLPDAELRRIPVPTELVWGRQDRFVPLSLAEETSGRLGWPLRVIDRAGHVPHIERPAEFLEALA